jgi:nicotinamidase-related amidase
VNRPSVVPRLIDVGDSQLVVIDVQPGFLSKIEPNDAMDLAHRVRWLITLARRLNVPVTVTEEDPLLNGATDDAVLTALPSGPRRHEKPAFGLTGSPHILSAVQAHNRNTAVLCGLETDVCVAQSAVGLAAQGLRVIVVTDACASPDTGHDQGLQRMRDMGIELIGIKGLAYEWLRTVAEAYEVMDDDLGSPRGIRL